MYDLIISNVDLLANSSNHEVMFPEYSRNIPRMSVSKIFQGYSRNNIFRGQKIQKIVLSVILWKLWYWQSLFLQCFSELYWNRFTSKVMIWKGSHRSLTAGKNFKIAQNYYKHYRSFPSGIYVSVSSAQRQIFVIARTFDIMQFDNML